jgi:hypothetical protein
LVRVETPHPLARIMPPKPLRRLPAWIASGFALLVLASCQRLGPASDQTEVARAFESWKSAIINHQPGQAMAYIPRHVDDYLNTLNTPPPASATNATLSAFPGVDLLLRRALEQKVPAGLRAKLTLSALIQRITDRNLFNPHDLREITLGPISVNGSRASGEVYYGGMLTAVRLPFVREDDGWKIDVMAILPYAETLMRLDRELKRETEEEQVDQLVAKLPSL